MQLISSENLKVSSEEYVYKAVMLWIKHDLDNRQQHLTKVIVTIICVSILLLILTTMVLLIISVTLT